MRDAHNGNFRKKHIFRHNFFIYVSTSKCQNQKVNGWVVGHLVTPFQSQILCAAANNRVRGHASVCGYAPPSPTASSSVFVSQKMRDKVLHLLSCPNHKAGCSDRFSLIYTVLILPMHSVTIQYIITCTDDTQLYVEFPNGPLEHSTSDAERMSRCITDVKTWLTQHKLALHDKKTEAIRITTVSTCHPRPTVIHVGALAVQFKPHVRNIGIVLDDTMTMAKHVSHTCRTAYYHLHNIASIRRSLTTSAGKIIVHSLVISRLDFGNATLYGISEALLHSTVDYRNPQTGAHFTSPVCTALVTHSPAHQIQAAGPRL